MLVDLYSVITASLSFAFGAAAFLFGICYTPYFRELAEKYPTSYLATLINITDNVVEKIIAGKHSKKPQPDEEPKSKNEGVKWKAVTSYRDFMSNDVLDIRHSISVIIDFSSRNVDKSLGLFTNTIGAISITFLAAALIFLILFLSSVAKYFGNSESFLVMTAFISGVLIISVYTIVFRTMLSGGNGVWDAVMRLKQRKYCLIDINSNTIRIGGMFGRYVEENREELLFKAKGEGLVYGLYLSNRSDPAYQVWIFTYPSFVAQLVLKKDELYSIEKRLNSLLSYGRALEEIDPEEHGGAHLGSTHPKTAS